MAQAQAQAGPSSANNVLDDPEYVHLDVIADGDTGISFICVVKRSIRMGAIKQKYSEAMSVPIERIRFVYFWRNIGDEETPETLRMGANEAVVAYHDCREDTENN